MRHLLDLDDLSGGELDLLLELCRPERARPVLAGRGVALIFEKPSNRTRNAGEMAVVGLGGHPVSIRGDEIGLGVRETPEDVVRVLGRYHSVVGARVFDHRHLEAMAAVAEVPVLNLLSDRGHPTQVVADLFTLRQRWGNFSGRRLAWVGDGNNVARSLVLGAAHTGLEVTLACPPGHHLEPTVLDAARALGGRVSQTDQPEEAVAGADAVYTDVWVSMGQEAEEAQRLDAFAGFRVTTELMAAAVPGAVFLHCLPAHRGAEVDAAVLEGPASAVWDQAGNRLHALRAILQWLVSGPEAEG
jgi:ornithine carbamoyltransferase